MAGMSSVKWRNSRIAPNTTPQLECFRRSSRILCENRHNSDVTMMSCQNVLTMVTEAEEQLNQLQTNIPLTVHFVQKDTFSGMSVTV